MTGQRKFYSVGTLWLGCLVIAGFGGIWQQRWQQMQHVMAEESVPEIPLYAGALAEFRIYPMAEIIKNSDLFVAAGNSSFLREEAVYSFLQGPKSWDERRVWSGEWSGTYARGGYFGNFACGLCCMANIYSTFTQYDCSPWDMYEHARQVSGYSPSKGAGAIGWGDMKQTLNKSGFDCALMRKPGSYETFREEIAGAAGAVVLVCSGNDDTFWKSTGGHYVNVWLYNRETDEVFLSDPGSPDRNRRWIPLRYVYDALKTVSQYQYLLVSGYSEDANEWKQDGIDEAWIAP